MSNELDKMTLEHLPTRQSRSQFIAQHGVKAFEKLVQADADKRGKAAVERNREAQRAVYDRTGKR